MYYVVTFLGIFVPPPLPFLLIFSTELFSKYVTFPLISDYVTHGWSLTNTNEKALTSVNNSDKRRQHVSKCLTFCVFIFKIDLENPNPCPKNVTLIRQ